MIKQEKIIRGLRNRIPSFKCLPGCHECCGPHPWSRWEWSQVKNKKEAAGLTCPYISDKGCEVYEHRPIICRLFGVVEDSRMKCPAGGTPEKVLSEVETNKIMKIYMKLLRKRAKRSAVPVPSGAQKKG